VHIFSFFLVFNHDIVDIDFTRIAGLTAIDDVTY